MEIIFKPQINSKRLFIAAKIVPDQAFLDLYSHITNTLSEERIRWVKPGNFHITLRFLGETDTTLIPEISSALTLSLHHFKPFILNLAGIGVFRSLSNPKVIWIGLRDSEYLISIKKEIDFHLSKLIDIKETGNTNMHLTIGRMKVINNIRGFKDLINVYRDINFIETRIDIIILYESILGKTGPVYNEMDLFPL